MSNMETARIIIDQMGTAGALRVMLGAHTFTALENGVSFKFKAGQGINYCKVILTSMDLYDVEIGNIHGMSYKVKYEAEGLFAEDLIPYFEDHTGLRLQVPRFA